MINIIPRFLLTKLIKASYLKQELTTAQENSDELWIVHYIKPMGIPHRNLSRKQ